MKPAFGSVRLQALQPHTIQKFINELSLAPSTARQACNVLSAALEQAEALDLIERNPVTRCTLPRIEKARELHVLSDPEIHSLLDAAEGRPIEPIIRFALFTGARMSEILALTWDCIDFDNGAIAITKQLAPAANRKSGELFTSTKNGKPRTIAAAASVLALLKDVHRGQLEARMLAGSLWDNPHDLVFTDGIGHALPPRTVAHWFESVRAAADLSDVRFHDLRHGYAILALRAGDSPKAVQGNLGHATASFTLDVYADYSDEMRKASARKIEDFLRENFNLNSGKGKNKGKST